MPFYDEKRAKISALVSEMQSRGLSIPREWVDALDPNRNLYWPMTEQGYFKKSDGTLYSPTPEQERFILSDAVFSLFNGGRGSGKSAAASQKALRKIKEGESGAILNPDFENFRISTWPSFKEWLPWDMVVIPHQYRRNPEWQPLQPFVMAFKNGARVICKGLKDPDSARGPNINWLWYDEAGRDLDGLAWQIAIASVRVGLKPQIWVSTTPRGKSSNWLYKFFVQKDIPQDALEAFEKLGENRPLIELFTGSIQDNQANLNPVFMATMLATYSTGYLRKQELYGEFVDAGGNLGDRHWFDNNFLDAPPEQVFKRIRYYDLAATEKKIIGGKEKNDPDETVGTKLSWNKVDFFMEDQCSAFAEYDGVLRLIKDTAIQDGIGVEIVVEQEPGSGGKNQVAAINEYIKKEIPGHPGVKGWRPDQDRVILFGIWAAEAKLGKIKIVKGNWNEGFLSQLDDFPEAKHDDKVTSLTGARINVAPIKSWHDIQFMSL